MGSIQTRPVDTTTVDNLIIGIPYVDFAPALVSGGFGSFRNLGIINDASINKTIELATLKSSQSGFGVLAREIVRDLEARLTITLFQHSAANMQYVLGSATSTTENSGTATITNEEVQLQPVATDWTDLEFPLIDTLTSLDPDTITAEAVGTGAGGTFGETQGDFSLDFSVLVLGDITAFTEGGVDRLADLVSGGSPAATEIGVIVGDLSTSGELVWPSGEAPASGDAIVATYLPSFAPVENTDFSVDYPSGRVRRITGSNFLRSLQPILVDYDRVTLDATVLKPFTQNTFSGKARIRLLTDVGINMDWTIPSVDLRLTDTDFEFSREEFGTNELVITMRDNGTTTPYGECRVYDENAA
jgi:hypothetical protein